MSKRIRLHALRQSTVGHTAIGLWRHPQSRAHEYRELRFWLETAQILERGKFDALFIADALGPLDVYEGKVDAALRDGIQTPTDDPLLVLSAMAAVTEHLGLAVTVSTTYEQPYSFARKMTTLDHLTGGRAGWNIVTSALESAARNLGYDRQIPHDERYVRAEEFMEVVYKLWEGSWEEDAVVRDAEAGVFARPDRVHPAAHDGTYYRVPDIALSEPSLQRTPVLYQAGTSPAGRAFAARHAEGVFLTAYTPAMARDVVGDIRRRAASAGRDPESLKFFTIATVIAAETDELARAKHADYLSYTSWEGSLARWSALMLIDLSQLDPDEPLEYADTEGIRGMVELFTKLDPTRAWTPRQIGEFVGVGGGGPVIVGSPATVADELERWMDEADVDGFNLTDPVPPVTYRDFAELVVPELQRRGRVWHDYEGSTLRESFYGPGRARVLDDHPAAAHRVRRPRAPALIEPADLAELLGEPGLRIFDATVVLQRPPEGGAYTPVSGRAEYEREHSPGASFADLIGELSDPESPFAFALPAPERLAAAAGRMGIGARTHVVAYAQDSPMWATRLWWLLRYIGFDDVSVLNGGLPAWKAAGLPLASGAVVYPPRDLAARPRPQLLATRADVEAVVAGAPACLINALTPPVFRGEGPTSYSRPGRIPGSVNVAWSSLIDAETNRFRERVVLWQALAAAGALTEEDVIVYCGGGISATVDAFALSLVGRDGVRLYDGSLTEWTADPALPVVVG